MSAHPEHEVKPWHAVSKENLGSRRLHYGLAGETEATKLDSATDAKAPANTRGLVINPIPVIDLFAGPGGLSEGFASVTDGRGRPSFRIGLSIEKEVRAHQTLELRAFFRQFPRGRAPDAYYDYLRGDVLRSELFAAFPSEAARAQHEAWHATLGEADGAAVSARIKQALGGSKQWVLIGGPPCQAYSLVGRSRRTRIARDVFESDSRHRLYREYLQILADHEPPVFVMENVKGLLSTKLEGTKLFERIVRDLEAPRNAVGHRRRGHRYRVVALTETRASKATNGSTQASVDFVVRSEGFGIPQARHRVILLGLRDDLHEEAALGPRFRASTNNINVEDVISDLPRLRSGLSKRPDSAGAWQQTISKGVRSWRASGEFKGSPLRSVLSHAVTIARNRAQMPTDRGGRFLAARPRPRKLGDWYVDPRLGGVCNHETRGHIESDLERYFFASCFAEVVGRSPTLKDFPNSLLPLHANATNALNGNLFSDRFRVQLKGRPSTTITSHISKDGHYYIHYDPRQCRSLTVRDAARLQTFPDNYFFEGSRTEQYVQVGNAVPPLLAGQIAEVVLSVLSAPGSDEVVSPARTAVR